MTQLQPQTSQFSIERRISDARASGIVFSEADVELIVDWSCRMNQAIDACRQSPSAIDPMGKGHAFPMGVGFTRMTPRLSQRLDSSVAKAGLARSSYAKANHAEKMVESLLCGIGTDLDRSEKAAKHAAALYAFVTRLLTWKKGTAFGCFIIERVSRDSGGYPSTYTISGGGVVKGCGDKVNIVGELFGGNVVKYRAMVDQAKATFSQSHQGASK